MALGVGTRQGRAASVIAMQLLLAGPAPASACNAPLWNRPYDHATASLVAEGWIERFVPRTDLYNRQFAFTPIDLVIHTEAAYKGQIPSSFTFRESASFAADLDRSENVANPQWGGSSGACGLFDADPTGLYILIALEESPGASGSDAIQTARLGRGPDDPRVAQLRQEIRSAFAQSVSPRIMLMVLASLIAVGVGLSLTVTGGMHTWLQRRR